MQSLDFNVVRWVKTEALESVKRCLDSRCMLVFDHFDRPLILFANQFTLNYFVERYPEIELVEALDVNNALQPANL